MPQVRIEKIKAASVKNFLPPRPPDAHKGTFGRVLVIAGSIGMTGAAALVTRSALLSGAGLVTCATARGQQPIVASAVLEALTLPLPENSRGSISSEAVDVLREFVLEKGADVMAIGSGLGMTGDTAEFALKAFMKLDIPAVCDADFLNAVSKRADLRIFSRRKSPSVLLPHPGEMSRLLGRPVPSDEKGRAAAAMECAEKTGCITVLKGSGTLVCSGGKSFINTTGGPALAKGGTGDVLCGMTAGLWAQYLKCGGLTAATGLKAVLCAVYLHGLCGDLAAKEKTARCVMAGGLTDYLPEAFSSL